MRHITVVDARMGRGKSSAAIRYMNRYKGTKCFMYVTPYLSEVDRVCEQCDFEEPDKDYATKSSQLKALMRKRCNISTTHALFSLMDEEALELAKAQEYCLIIDESPTTIQGVSVSPKDKDLMLEHLLEVNEDYSVKWVDENYDGKFNDYKEMADSNTLFYYSSSFYNIMSPAQWMPFSEVYLMTYLFEGQLIRAYFDYFGFTYNIVGILRDKTGYIFSDKPDEPPNVDYSRLIHIVGVENAADARMNDVGESKTALSVSWFMRRGYAHPDIKRLSNNLRNFFNEKTNSAAEQRLWTCYKDNSRWITGSRNRYSNSFLALNARATNKFQDTDCVAYLVNRFIDPNISKFFAAKEIDIDPELFALSEMLQFIWRSAIRQDKEISLYIPSRRMRTLLIGWIKEINNGGNHDR